MTHGAGASWLGGSMVNSWWPSWTRARRYLLLLDKSGDEEIVLGYLILQMGLAPHEQERFNRYGIEYDPALLCARCAPVIAEGWQSGLGTPAAQAGAASVP